MKSFVLLVSMLFALSNFANAEEGNLSAFSTLMPFISSESVVNLGISTTEIVASPFVTSLGMTLESRGVAGREQIKDDLSALDTDVASGKVKLLSEIRQPALKELFEEISSDSEKMDEINKVMPAISELNRIATAVALTMFSQY